MKRIVGLLFLLLLTGKCFAFSYFSECEAVASSGNGYECLRYLESNIAKDNPNLFTREDQRLTINLFNGKKLVFNDEIRKEPDSDYFKAHVFSRYFPAIGYGVISIAYYEDMEFQLIDLKTGTQTKVAGDVMISPDNRRLLIQGEDDLHVYIVTPHGLHKEYVSPKFKDWLDVQWKDSRNIEAKLAISDKNTPGFRTKLLAVHFSGKDISKEGRWTLK